MNPSCHCRKLLSQHSGLPQADVGTNDDWGIDVRYAVFDSLLRCQPYPAICTTCQSQIFQKRARHPEQPQQSAMLPHSHASFRHLLLPPCGHLVISSTSLSSGSTGVPAACASRSRSCSQLHVAVPAFIGLYTPKPCFWPAT